MCWKYKYLENKDKWTEEDAHDLVLDARTSSLWREKLTEDYLSALRKHVADWLDSIDRTIKAGYPETKGA